MCGLGTDSDIEEAINLGSSEAVIISPASEEKQVSSENLQVLFLSQLKLCDFTTEPPDTGLEFFDPYRQIVRQQPCARLFVHCCLA